MVDTNYRHESFTFRLFAKMPSSQFDYFLSPFKPCRGCLVRSPVSSAASRSCIDTDCESIIRKMVASTIAGPFCSPRVSYPPRTTPYLAASSLDGYPQIHNTETHTLILKAALIYCYFDNFNSVYRLFSLRNQKRSLPSALPNPRADLSAIGKCLIFLN